MIRSKEQQKNDLKSEELSSRSQSRDEKGNDRQNGHDAIVNRDFCRDTSHLTVSTCDMSIVCWVVLT